MTTSDIIHEVLASPSAVWFGFCAGMACMWFLWWISDRKGGRR